MKDTDQQIGILNTLMVANSYPVGNPVAPNLLAGLKHKAPPIEWDAHKKAVYEDIQRLLANRQDYSRMFEIMDGLEYNGLTLYSLVQAENNEPLWSNIYLRNFEARDNDIYVDPNLTDKVLIGEDGMSVFAYSPTENCFEIRDKVTTYYVIDSKQKFSDFLSELINTVN